MPFQKIQALKFIKTLVSNGYMLASPLSLTGTQTLKIILKQMTKFFIK